MTRSPPLFSSLFTSDVLFWCVPQVACLVSISILALIMLDLLGLWSLSVLTSRRLEISLMMTHAWSWSSDRNHWSSYTLSVVWKNIGITRTWFLNCVPLIKDRRLDHTPLKFMSTSGQLDDMEALEQYCAHCSMPYLVKEGRQSRGTTVRAGGPHSPA